jgi:hypothetical protein
MIFDAISASDADIRKDLYSNIILTGGNSLLPGTHDTRHTTHDTRHTTHDTRHTTHDTDALWLGEQGSWIDCTRS